VRSRYAESSVPMAGSAITLQSPRACTGALLNAMERIDRAEDIVDRHTVLLLDRLNRITSR